ncbi:hypothetical protein P7K49_014132, partial [Saguinus oedipus]
MSYSLEEDLIDDFTVKEAACCSCSALSVEGTLKFDLCGRHSKLVCIYTFPGLQLFRA